jgi:hypothetical protein
MPSIPDIPGKGLVTGTTKRARVVAGAAAAGALAAGGFVAKRVLAHGRGEDDEAAPGAEAAPIPVREKPAPKPKPVKPKAAKAKPPKPKAGKAAPPKPKEPKAGDKPKPAKPKADKPKAAKPKPAKPPKAKADAGEPKAAPKPKPAKATAVDAPPKPAFEPGDRSHDKEPHHALNNPVADPDETEYPDPFEKREDPRDPVDPDDAPFGEEPHPQVGSESTSEPPPALDPAVGDLAKPPKRDNLDD